MDTQNEWLNRSLVRGLAWNTVDGYIADDGWVTGFLHYVPPYNGNPARMYCRLENETEVEIDPSTACHCTGVHDSHLNLIYEHDQLCIDTPYGHYALEEVIWSTQRGCYVAGAHTLGDYISLKSQLRVVGNALNNMPLGPCPFNCAGCDKRVEVIKLPDEDATRYHIVCTDPKRNCLLGADCYPSQNAAVAAWHRATRR